MGQSRGSHGEKYKKKREKQREREKGERSKQSNIKREKVIQAREPTSDICQREMRGRCTIEKAWAILPGREAGVVGGEGEAKQTQAGTQVIEPAQGLPSAPPLRYFGSKTSSYRYPVFTSSQTLH